MDSIIGFEFKLVSTHLLIETFYMVTSISHLHDRAAVRSGNEIGLSSLGFSFFQGAYTHVDRPPSLSIAIRN